MGDDPLAEYRRKPLIPSAAQPSKDTDEYAAFAGKDKSLFLEIRRVKDPARSPRYNYLLDVSFDDTQGTNFVLVYTFLLVMVRGRNLSEVIFAIQNGMARYIQEFDPARWSRPKDEKAPVIESIEIHVLGGKIDAANDNPTTN